MKKFALPLFVVVAFVVAIAFAGSAYAGGQCCVSTTTACKVSADAGKTSATSATATTATTRTANDKAVSAKTGKSTSMAQCNGKVCVPCDPSDCKGIPCSKCCDQSKCQRSNAETTSASGSAL